MRQTFPKTEHLTSKRVINRLFDRTASGPDAPLSVYAYPFRVLFVTSSDVSADSMDVPDQSIDVVATPAESTDIDVAAELGRTNVPPPTILSPELAPTQVLFSVPKRTFKKAVDRNLMRRRCREAYRLNKRILQKQTMRAQPVAITFLYTAKAKISFEDIEKGMKLALKRVSGFKPQISSPAI